MRKAILLGVVAGGLVLASGLFGSKQHTGPYEASTLNAFFLLLHIVGGSIGVLVAPLLFLKNSTNGKLFRIHAPLGKLYVGAIAAACAGGLYVNQFVEKGGLVSQLAFAVQFTAWGGATLVAYRKIRAHQVISHSLWIIRSVALTASFVTYGWWVGLFAGALPVSTYGPHLAYNVADWLTWLANLLVAEVIIVYLKRKYKDRYARELVAA